MSVFLCLASNVLSSGKRNDFCMSLNRSHFFILCIYDGWISENFIYQFVPNLKLLNGSEDGLSNR